MPALVAGIHVDTVEGHGVKQARTTVTYRFSQPDQPMPLVLPQSYSTGSVIRIPVEPKTIGDHIRKRRLGLKMPQREVGKQIGVDEMSIHNWETNLNQPRLEYMPAIIRFLGYNPLPQANTIAEQLVHYRTALGMTQKEACKIAVDPGTLAKSERGEREPAGAFLMRAEAFLGIPSDSERGVA